MQAGPVHFPKNHLQDITFTSSTNSSHRAISLLKIQAFLAFQITQITTSQINHNPLRIFLIPNVFNLILCFLFQKYIYVLLEFLENDKILVFYISYIIELLFVHILNLVCVVWLK